MATNNTLRSHLFAREIWHNGLTFTVRDRANPFRHYVLAGVRVVGLARSRMFRSHSGNRALRGDHATPATKFHAQLAQLYLHSDHSAVIQTRIRRGRNKQSIVKNLTFGQLTGETKSQISFLLHDTRTSAHCFPKKMATGRHRNAELLNWHSSARYDK